MTAPIPQSLAFNICEMGTGKGWKPRGGAPERGSEEKEAGVRARSFVGDQGSRDWDSGMLGTSLSNSSSIHKANLPLCCHQDLPYGGWGWETKTQSRAVTSQGHSEHCGNMGRLKSRAPRGSVLPDLADDSQLPEKLSQGFHSKHAPSLHPDSPWRPFAHMLVSLSHPLRGKKRSLPTHSWAAHVQDGLLGILRPSQDDTCASSLPPGLPAWACPILSLSGWVGDQ